MNNIGMNKVIRVISHPGLALKKICKKFLLLLPDEPYLRVRYRQEMGKRLNLTNPQTFSEKIQWLKLYDRQPEYTMMVDKYAVKDYVARILGEEFIIPTLVVWDNVEDIEWDKLPDQFVLKCTHDSGGQVICRDKSILDKEEAVRILRWGMKQNYYRKTREWPYKNVPRRIIAEKYIKPAPGTDDLADYKFFCFNGEPRYCQVISGRGKKMCIDFFDMKWRHQPFHEPKNYPFADIEPARPMHFDRMQDAARQLTKGRAFCRIDFYEVGDKVYFGEITFYPTSGMGGFDPEEWDYSFGKWITLPKRMGR